MHKSFHITNKASKIRLKIVEIWNRNQIHGITPVCSTTKLRERHITFHFSLTNVGKTLINIGKVLFNEF